MRLTHADFAKMLDSEAGSRRGGAVQNTPQAYFQTRAPGPGLPISKTRILAESARSLGWLAPRLAFQWLIMQSTQTTCSSANDAAIEEHWPHMYTMLYTSLPWQAAIGDSTFI